MKIIKKLKSYFVKFNKNKIIKNNKYLLNCIIKNANQKLIIIIIYNESIFVANDSI